jgi:putative hydrolase of the HAD superfamily
MKLKMRGYRIGVITDGLSVKQWEKLIRLGLEDVFDSVVVSEDVGVEKPDPVIFKQACDAMGVKPKECIYVGDRLDTDVVGANGVGMLSVRLLRGKYKDARPDNLQQQPRFEIQKLDEIMEILKNA